ncbi:hypothetical protein ONS96_010259 [Cadophora gregata f. sp. sojae]|nr:hypothetical protein ONS96_010259 [Cadophora gregata f. sp. sojae]
MKSGNGLEGKDDCSSLFSQPIPTHFIPSSPSPSQGDAPIRHLPSSLFLPFYCLFLSSLPSPSFSSSSRFLLNTATTSRTKPPISLVVFCLAPELELPRTPPSPTFFPIPPLLYYWPALDMNPPPSCCNLLQSIVQTRDRELLASEDIPTRALREQLSFVQF